MHCITNGPDMIHLTSAMQRTFCGPRLANIPIYFVVSATLLHYGYSELSKWHKPHQSKRRYERSVGRCSAPWGVWLSSITGPNGVEASRKSFFCVLPRCAGPGSDPELSKCHKNRQSKRRYQTPHGAFQTPHGAFANAPWGVCVFSAPWRAG